MQVTRTFVDSRITPRETAPRTWGNGRTIEFYSTDRWSSAVTHSRGRLGRQAGALFRRPAPTCVRLGVLEPPVTPPGLRRGELSNDPRSDDGLAVTWDGAVVLIPTLRVTELRGVGADW